MVLCIQTLLPCTWQMQGNSTEWSVIEDCHESIDNIATHVTERQTRAGCAQHSFGVPILCTPSSVNFASLHQHVGLVWIFSQNYCSRNFVRIWAFVQVAIIIYCFFSVQRVRRALHVCVKRHAFVLLPAQCDVFRNCHSLDILLAAAYGSIISQVRVCQSIWQMQCRGRASESSSSIMPKLIIRPPIHPPTHQSIQVTVTSSVL